MHLLQTVILRNFKSFREKTTFDLADGSYLVGVNNSGKSSVLHAIHGFFDEAVLQGDNFVNKTSFLSKKAGSNVVEITVIFNLDALTNKNFKQSLIKSYGHSLMVSKIISVATDTKMTSYSYKLNDGGVLNELPVDVSKLLKSVKVTYLHPQEGQSLLKNAQKKLRQRLLANWGRGANITQSIKTLQNDWDDLRTKSKTYLSGTLTESLQKMWPESQVTINLPKDIKDIIAVSDINFSGYKNAPEIELTSQGTGAQSTILYLTHFLLDSDRSLHRGEYHPVWLVEEPESFLHIDLLANLSKQLNSVKWLSNIQMIVSTHSPVLLAGSRVAKQPVRWVILSERTPPRSKLVTEYSDDDIKRVGDLMGDPNFFAYFLAAQENPLVFIEDEKSITQNSYVDAGIEVTKGLKGISDVARFIEVFIAAPFVLNNKTFFIVDSDKGKNELSRFYTATAVDKKKDGFSRYKVNGSESVFLVFLPDGFSAENLFSEFPNHLEECISKLLDPATWKLLSSAPTEFAGAAAYLRKKNIISKDEAIALIKNHDDIKASFWTKVEKFGYQIEQKSAQALIHLIS